MTLSSVRKKRRIVFITVLAILLILFILYKAEQQPAPPPEPLTPPREPAKYELTQVDLFAIKNFTALDISVKNIRLDDTFPYVLKTLGYPDKQSTFEGNTKVLEYSKNIGLEEPGLLIHFQNDLVDRITVKTPFNKFLVGKTKINYTKETIYFTFGVPPEVEHIPIKQGSFLLYRVLKYPKKGLDVITRKGDVNGLSFVIPS